MSIHLLRQIVIRCLIYIFAAVSSPKVLPNTLHSGIRLLFAYFNMRNSFPTQFLAAFVAVGHIFPIQKTVTPWAYRISVSRGKYSNLRDRAWTSVGNRISNIPKQMRLPFFICDVTPTCFGSLVHDLIEASASISTVGVTWDDSNLSAFRGCMLLRSILIRRFHLLLLKLHHFKRNTRPEKQRSVSDNTFNFIYGSEGKNKVSSEQYPCNHLIRQ